MVKSNRSTGLLYDGIALVRITVGVLLMVNGWELFVQHDLGVLAELIFNMSIPFPDAMIHTSKLVQLTAGFFLILGLFTRLVATLMIATFVGIAFLAGEGRIFSDDQLPFLYVLFGLTFLFTGAGRISVDFILFANRKDNQERNIAAKGFGRYVSRS